MSLVSPKWKAFAWTWCTFFEGFAFGHFLGWVWALAWFGAWLLARVTYEIGRHRA